MKTSELLATISAILIALFVVLVLARCTTEIPEPPEEPPVPVEPAPYSPPKASCKMVAETVVLVNRAVKLPATGKLVGEAHYVTKEEGFWPSNQTDRIEAHLAASCKTLRDMGLPASEDCTEIYRPALSRHERVWTPAEGGKVGQGARGDFVRPERNAELWQGNMFFKGSTLPKMGTKFLARNAANGKAVVVAVGYEIGPGGTEFLGGITREPQWWLGASNSTPLEWGRLQDQSAPLGPVTCE